MRQRRQGASEPTFPEAPSLREGAMAAPCGPEAPGPTAFLETDVFVRHSRVSGNPGLTINWAPAFAGATRPARGFPENGNPGLRIGRAGDADPGSLLRRRRRVSALPEVSIPPGLAALLGARPTPVLRNPYARRVGNGCNTSLVLRSFDRGRFPEPRSFREADDRC